MLALCMQGCFGEAGKEPAAKPTIVFDKTSAVMEKNEVLEINAIVLPEGQTFYWYSTDTSVAQVIYGKVLAVGPGNASVVAFTDGGVIACCNIRVLDASIPLYTADMKDYFDYEITYGDIVPQDLESVDKVSVFNSDECRIHIEIIPKVEGNFKNVTLTLKLEFESEEFEGDSSLQPGWQPIAVSIDLDENGYGNTSDVIKFLNVAIPQGSGEPNVVFTAKRPVELKDKMVCIMKGFYNKEK